MEEKKAFSKSLTVRFNGALIAIGVAIAKLSAILVALQEVSAVPQAKEIIAMLPPHTQELVGAFIALVGAANIFIRVLKTKGPVAGPKITPGNGTAAVLAFLATLWGMTR